eukprot:SAG31_NODE_13695_length_852_cov_2.019920_1_plen_57_part_10
MTPEYCASACYAGESSTLKASGGGILLVGPEAGSECFCDGEGCYFLVFVQLFEKCGT